jgi:hypothetical protein
VFFEDAGMKIKDVNLLRVGNGAAVTVYTNGDLSGNSSVYTTGEYAIEAGGMGSIKVAPA